MRDFGRAIGDVPVKGIPILGGDGLVLDPEGGHHSRPSPDAKELSGSSLSDAAVIMDCVMADNDRGERPSVPRLVD